MEYYCSKCLVNRVEHEGDVCATCGGTAGTGDGRSTARNFSPVQGEVHVSSRRRLMGSASSQAASPVVPPSDAGTARPDDSNFAGEADAPAVPKKSGQDSRSGVIQNFTAGPDERTFLDRVLESLFLGISYNGKNNLFMTEFQLYENWNSGYSASSSAPQATRVVYYGKVAQGRPVENNDVTVYGVFDHKNNYFIAERIMNQTDGTYANFMPQKTPAALIRVLVAGLLLAVVLGAVSLFTGGFGGGEGAVVASSGTSGGFQQILLGLIVTAAGAAAIIWSRSSRQPRLRFPMIMVGAMLVLLGVFIMTVQDLEGRLALFKAGVISTVIMAVVLRMGASLLLGIISKPTDTVERLLNWATIILVIVTLGSMAINIFLS